MTADDRQNPAGRVVALCGGVGGAKLALGLSRRLGETLTLVVNTGDDFEHLGLHVSPDLDTVLYTLSGIANRERGWGREDESWNFLETLGALGGDTWFQLGDRDLALHVLRTQALAAGRSLTDLIREVAGRLGIAAHVLPMCDAPVRTIVETSQGALPFQRYFVEQRCAPAVEGLIFEGAGTACPSEPVTKAFRADDLRAVVICPSNPFLSVDPILAVPGMRDLLRAAKAPVVAVSPLVGGAAVKGPTAKIMQELGVPVTNKSVANHYAGLIDGLVIDGTDAEAGERLPLPVCTTRTLMESDEDKDRLADAVLGFAADLADGRDAGRGGST